MRGRECLGEFDGWSKKLEKDKVNDVLTKARTTSRLTSGEFLDTPVNFYQVTYLFKKKTTNFIRGWHCIKGEAFYLSDVFLEHTFEDGQWIKNQTEWSSKSNNFDLTETFNKLHSKKLGISSSDNSNSLDINQVKNDFTLYTSENIFREVSTKTKLKQKLRTKKRKKNNVNNRNTKKVSRESI